MHKQTRPTPRPVVRLEYVLKHLQPQLKQWYYTKETVEKLQAEVKHTSWIIYSSMFPMIPSENTFQIGMLLYQGCKKLKDIIFVR